MQLRQRMSLAVALFLGFSGSVSFARPNLIDTTEHFYDNASGSPLLPLLNSAKQNIDIEIYEMDDPLVHAALEAAVDRGVQVRVLKDGNPVGGACKVFETATSQDSSSCASEKSLVTYIQKKGGTYLAFNKAALCARNPGMCFEHGKMVIRDQNTVLLSTGNFNSTNLCNKNEHPNNCNRDYTVLSTDSAVVNLLETIFNQDLRGNAYDVLAVMAKSSTRKVTISPESLSPLVSFLNSAKTSIQIQNQYLKDPDLNQAILNAAKRGVHVEVMVSSACSFGPPSPSEAQKWSATYNEFDQAGIQTRIFTRKILIDQVSGYLHAKAMVVDHARAWVGSVNGSTLSLSSNREYGIFLLETGQVQNLSQIMEADFLNPNGESWQDSLGCKNDPKPAPQAGSARDLAASFFEK